MKNILSDLAYDITQTIKGSGRVIMMYDEDGNRTYDQREAAKIFAYPDKMMVIITDNGIDSSVDVGLSQSTDVTELQDFITTLRHLCTNYNVLFNINKYGKEITPKDFANYGSSNDLSECLEYYNKNRVIVNEASLSDYKTIKNNDWGLPANLIEWLKGKGFKMIGKGHFSYIFSSDTEDFVVKVNNGKRMDEGYLQFVEFCQQNKGNPHLPKIGTVKKYENWYIVFIEKLEDFHELSGYSKIKLVVEIKDEADNWKTSMTGDIVKQVKECGNILKRIKFLGDEDFHSDNLMKRGDTLVITDPLI